MACSLVTQPHIAISRSIGATNDLVNHSSEQLISNLKFYQATSTSPFMDVIEDVYFSILLKRREQIGDSFIAN